MPRGEHLKKIPGIRIGGGPGRPKGCKDKKPRKKKRPKKVIVQFVKEDPELTNETALREYLDSLPPMESSLDNIKPEAEIHIAKCCATCKHFMPIAAATGYHRGFCTFGHKEELKSGIRIKYHNVHSIIGSLKDILPKLRAHYPEVHEHFVCDNYVKVTNKKRFKYLLQLLKTIQNKIIWEKDLEV